MRNFCNTQKIIITIVAIVAIAIGYYMFQSINSPAKAVAKQENTVQLASEQPKIKIKKATPTHFNGEGEKGCLSYFR